MPRDRDGAFPPKKFRQRRLGGIDDIVRLLTARGLTNGEIAVHFDESYGASVPKDAAWKVNDAAWKVNDKVIEEVTKLPIVRCIASIG